jgi:septal ring factor EnvC (AmiA/AmiB activator)
VPGGATVGINSEHRVEIARTLERIQHNFISDDQSATLIDACISALDYAPTLEERVKQLAEAKEKSAEVIFAELNSLIADQRREIAWLEAEIEKTKEDLALPAEERTATAADLNELENSLANATRNLRELENSRGSGEAALVDTLSTSSFESPLIATCKTILADPNSVKELVSLGSDLRLERMSVEKDLVAQQAAKRGMDVKIKALELCAGYSADKDNAKLPDSLKAMCDAQFEALAAN